MNKRCCTTIEPSIAPSRELESAMRVTHGIERAPRRLLNWRPNNFLKLRPAPRGTMSDGNFDVVILSHVLEHFTDPKRLVRSALNALTRDGIVVIEVPNDVPGIFPLNGPDEPHLTFFTAQTLATLLGTSAVFAAGPPYRNKSVGAHVRRIAARVLQDTPVVSRFVMHGRMRVISPSSFAMRRQNGVFLRAVLRNPQKTVGKDRKTPQAHAAAPAQA